MKRQIFITHNAEETRVLGEQLARAFRGGQVVLLKGNLGAGKTHFAQGVARGLGIIKNITSPTFTIMNIHDAPRRAYANAKKINNNAVQILSRTTQRRQYEKITRLAHIDLYRIKTIEEAYAIGVMDYISEPSTLTLIEWPGKIQHALPNKDRVWVRITTKANQREMRTLSISF